MATKGVELASAYVSLSFSTKDLPGQLNKALNGSTKDAQQAGTRMGTAYSNAVGVAATSGMARHGRNASARFGDGFQSDAERRGAKIGTAVGTVIGRGIGLAISASLTAATAGLGAVVGGLGYTLFKGFDRYKSLDATAKRLGQMGKTGEQVKSIIADINEVVEGTPIALDAAAGAATKFLQGGVKEGKELKDTLAAIADAAGASGTDFSHLVDIFQKVALKGELSGDTIAQLEENLVPISAWLKQMPQLAEDGTVSWQDFLTAVNNGAGGLAKSMGDTIDGALGNMQTAVARVGANFLSAIFGDPLSTTEGPGGMAEAINNVTAKIDGLNQWVVGHQGEIKQFFTDAGEAAKTVADAVKNVGGFLKEHPGLIQGVVIAFGAWKTIQGVAALTTALTSISTLLRVKLPADAAAGAAGMSSALLPIAALAGSIAAVTDGRPQDYVGNGPLSPKAAADNKDWGRVLFGDAANWPSEVRSLFGDDQPPMIPGGGGPGAQRQRRGVAGPTNPLDVFAPTASGGMQLNPFGQTGGGGNSMRAGGSPREFAHSTMMPYWQKQGFQVGDHEADQYGEHQNGALDIMIPNLAAGQRILQEILQDPNVYGAIFNGQSYGYGRGMTPQPYSGPNPHTDHVHVWYKPKGMASGGDVRGAGSATSDSIPAYLSNGEHVLTANDVAAMGGQAGVYAFRNALHRSTGGEIALANIFDSQYRNTQYAAGVGRMAGHPWWWGKSSREIDRGGRGPYRGGKKTITMPWQVLPPLDQHERSRKNVHGWGFAEGGAVDPALLMQLFQQGQAAVDAKKNEGVAPPASDRTEGYIPAGAGYSGSTGGGLAGGFINMGAEAINGLIDQAAAAGAMGANMFAPGSGQAVQMGAQAAKRLVSWGAQMAGIGIGAVTEILSPFGAPRWLADVDPTSFMPQWSPQQSATTTGEKTGLAAKGEQYDPLKHTKPGPGGPGEPVQPGQFPGAGGVISGTQAFQAKASGPVAPFDPMKSTAAPGQAAIGANMAKPSTTPPSGVMQDPMSFLSLFGFKNGGAVYDRGGVLEPNSYGINLSNRPEAVLNASQWKAMEANAAQTVKGGDGATYNVYAANVDEAIRELRKNERRNARQYSVRP